MPQPHLLSSFGRSGGAVAPNTYSQTSFATNKLSQTKKAGVRSSGGRPTESSRAAQRRQQGRGRLAGTRAESSVRAKTEPKQADGQRRRSRNIQQKLCQGVFCVSMVCTPSRAVVYLLSIIALRHYATTASDPSNHLFFQVACSRIQQSSGRTLAFFRPASSLPVVGRSARSLDFSLTTPPTLLPLLVQSA